MNKSQRLIDLLEASDSGWYVARDNEDGGPGVVGTFDDLDGPYKSKVEAENALKKNQKKYGQDAETAYYNADSDEWDRDFEGETSDDTESNEKPKKAFISPESKEVKDLIAKAMKVSGKYLKDLEVGKQDLKTGVIEIKQNRHVDTRSENKGDIIIGQDKSGNLVASVHGLYLDGEGYDNDGFDATDDSIWKNVVAHSKASVKLKDDFLSAQGKLEDEYRKAVDALQKKHKK